MKTQIAPRLKKALLASMSILALSLTCSSALADNENYDGKWVEYEDFSNQSLKDSSWIGAILSLVDFSNANLTNANFTNAILDDGISLNGADLSGADFRGATVLEPTPHGPDIGFYPDDHNNFINQDGKILNLTLSSATDSLTIRGGTDINAYLDGTVATISGGATLTLTQNAVLELRGGTQLTLANDGKLALTLDAAAPSSLTSIVIKSGSSLDLAPNAILDITIENFVGAEMEFNILSWENDADVAELLAQLNDGASLRINGQLGYTGTIDYATKTFSVSYIPEPSTATLSLFALAGLLARRRRKVA